MVEYTADAALSPLARALRTGERRPTAVVEEARERFAAVEPAIEAFLQEPDRWERLDREAAALEARHTGGRPALYGVPVGVKDVFHVDGMETRAGSALPPRRWAVPRRRQ